MNDANTLSPAVRHRVGSDIWRLAIAQALAGANSVVIFATGAIIGSMLAPSQSLATLPVSLFVVGMAAWILPAGAIARRHGRRAGFMAGSACGVLAGLLAAAAVITGSFWLFCMGTFFGGAYGAVVQSFRFAAADCVEPARKARALSIVMAGGIAAGVVGPQLVTTTMNLWPAHMFAVTFLAQAAIAVASGIVLSGVRLARPVEAAVGLPAGRPLSVIIRQPAFITAAFCGAVSYTLMNFLMTAAPLAMRLCGHSQAMSNLGIQWHVVAMYAPSFFTGRLITRFGAPTVVTVGLASIGLSGAIGLAGADVAHFWLTLILLGIGWNFGFVGASAMVLEVHSAEEATRVQSMNDFIIFGLMAIGSFSSGELLTVYGWDAVLWVSFGPLMLALIAMAVSQASARRLDAS